MCFDAVDCTRMALLSDPRVLWGTIPVHRDAATRVLNLIYSPNCLVLVDGESRRAQKRGEKKSEVLDYVLSLLRNIRVFLIEWCQIVRKVEGSEDVKDEKDEVSEVECVLARRNQIRFLRVSLRDS